MFCFHVYIMALFNSFFLDSSALAKFNFVIFSVFIFVTAPNLWIARKQRVSDICN